MLLDIHRRRIILTSELRHLIFDIRHVLAIFVFFCSRLRLRTESCDGGDLSFL